MNYLNLLEDPVDDAGKCVTAVSDRATLKITKTGSVFIKVTDFGGTKVLRLLAV